MDYGYLRFSRTRQRREPQLDGVALDRRFIDTLGSRVRDRPQLAALLEQIRPGDTIHVHSLDRLARSMTHLLKLVDTITKRGARLVFHCEGLTFDGSTDTVRARAQLQMLGAVVRFELTLIDERARETRAVRNARSLRPGRPVVLTPVRVRRGRAERVEGEPAAAIVLDLDRRRPIIYRALLGGNRRDKSR